MTKVVHSFRPVVASIAVTCPLNVQHSYVETAPVVVSIADMGTYSRPSYSVADPVLFARGCAPARVFQSSFPFCAWSAEARGRTASKWRAYVVETERLEACS